MVWVPSVATKGGSLNFATREPLTTPVASAAAKATRIAGMGWLPLQIIVAIIMQVMPTTEPMDRSMFAVIRT